MIPMGVPYKDGVGPGDISFLDTERLAEWRARVIVISIEQKYLAAIIHFIVSAT
jgi:hypothetical protein